MGIVGIGGPFGQVPEAWPLRVKPLAVGWQNHTWQSLACSNNPCNAAQSIVFTRQSSRITQGGSFLISPFNSRTVFFAAFEPRDSGTLITIAKDVTMSAFSVGDLMNLLLPTSVFETLKHQSWQLHVNDFGSALHTK